MIKICKSVKYFTHGTERKTMSEFRKMLNKKFLCFVYDKSLILKKIYILYGVWVSLSSLERKYSKNQ